MPGSADIVERTLPIAMLCLAIVAVPVLVLEPAGLPRLRALEHEVDDVEAENRESAREVERLRVEVRELRDDPAAVERIARGELGMVRKSEVVFQFGGPPSAWSPPARTPSPAPAAPPAPAAAADPRPRP